MAERSPSGDEYRVRGTLQCLSDGSAIFYTFFYTAGREWLVRSGTDRYVECAKPQPRGTRRDRTGPRERQTIRLITRRSQVQILPPPPSRTLETAGLRACCSGFRPARIGPCSPDRSPDSRIRVARRSSESPKSIATVRCERTTGPGAWGVRAIGPGIFGRRRAALALIVREKSGLVGSGIVG